MDHELGQLTRVEFEETPLGEVIDFLEGLYGIEIELDQFVLDESGIGADSPVTLRVHAITLRTAMRLMLRKIDPKLTYIVQGSVLQITTVEVAQKNPLVRVYNVRNLLKDNEDVEELAKRLAKVLRASHQGKGGRAKAKEQQTVLDISHFRHTLIVCATEDGQDQVRAILRSLDAGRKNRPRAELPKAARTNAVLEFKKKMLKQRVNHLSVLLKRERAKNQPEEKVAGDPFGVPNSPDKGDDPFEKDPFGGAPPKKKEQ